MCFFQQVMGYTAMFLGTLVVCRGPCWLPALVSCTPMLQPLHLLKSSSLCSQSGLGQHQYTSNSRMMPNLVLRSVVSTNSDAYTILVREFVFGNHYEHSSNCYWLWSSLDIQKLDIRMGCISTLVEKFFSVQWTWPVLVNLKHLYDAKHNFKFICVYSSCYCVILAKEFMLGKHFYLALTTFDYGYQKYDIRMGYTWYT